MGSKVIMLLGVLISALFLYFCITKFSPISSIKSSEIKRETVKQTDVVSAAKPIEEVAPAIPEEETKVEQKVVERISTPAFGFMTGERKHQIVALMSDNDEDGILAKSIDELCSKMECSKDIRYENDIIDAKWQQGVVDIIKLLTTGDIKGGSLFIEGNILKVEGSIENRESLDALNKILDSVKSDTFKVENYTKTSSNVKPVAVDEIKPDIVKDKVNENKAVTKVETKEEIKKIEKSKEVPKKVDKKIVTKQKVKMVRKDESISDETESDIVAQPVMETTLDAESRVKAILQDIKKDTKASGLVAKPHMETTAE